MASKPQAPGPSLKATSSTSIQKDKTSTDQKLFRQPTTATTLDASTEAKPKNSKPTVHNTPTVQSSNATPPQPRRKPRKLNTDPQFKPAQVTAQQSTSTPSMKQVPEIAELEALKSRVRGLEARVEQLYSNTEAKGTRSPRRRGRGRKQSWAAQNPTISNTSTRVAAEGEDREQDADEKLTKLEDELEVARQDLAAFPRRNRAASKDVQDVQEITRRDADEDFDNKHVTLSGSYRIPLPTSVSLDDVRSIRDGVSAAQNVARNFLEQRRVAAMAQDGAPQGSTRPAHPRSVSSSMEVAVATDADGSKQSWGDWIGGYSVAITRAMKSVEHDVGVEREGGSKKLKENVGRQGARRKRPAAKASLSSEQVKGLMK